MIPFEKLSSVLEKPIAIILRLIKDKRLTPISGTTGLPVACPYDFHEYNFLNQHRPHDPAKIAEREARMLSIVEDEPDLENDARYPYENLSWKYLHLPITQVDIDRLINTCLGDTWYRKSEVQSLTQTPGTNADTNGAPLSILRPWPEPLVKRNFIKGEGIILAWQIMEGALWSAVDSGMQPHNRHGLAIERQEVSLADLLELWAPSVVDRRPRPLERSDLPLCWYKIEDVLERFPLDELSSGDQEFILEHVAAGSWQKHGHKMRVQTENKPAQMTPVQTADAKEGPRNPPSRPVTRKNQMHRERARKIAAKKWGKDSKTSPTPLTAVVSYIQGRTDPFDGKTYPDRTIRDWIRDLNPAYTPGRRGRK